MKLNMDNLPTVISCCFCCFIRAGTVMIAFFSLISGLVFAPNVGTIKGFWDMDPLLTYYSTATVTTIQIIFGVISIMLCIVSLLLLVGAICNIPILILIYQWGAVVYCAIVFILLLVLAMVCFFVHANCIVAGVILCALMVVEVLLTVYFVIVANSLRMSLTYISSSELYG